MTFIYSILSREALLESVPRICTGTARRSGFRSAHATRGDALLQHRLTAIVLLGVIVAMSVPSAHATALYMRPCYADGNLLPIACLLATGFGLLAAALWVHAYEQRSSIAQLAAAIEKRSSAGAAAHPLAEFGSPSVVRLARAINGAQRRDAERIAELLDVLAAYAHDLRTPLARISLRCERLDEGDLHDAMERDLAEMGELVAASLACARMQCWAGEPLRRFDADGLLGNLVDNYKDAGRSIELEGQVGCPLVTCPHALRRVLVNLIDNALRYGSDVRLCVRVDARRVVLTVVDSGPGIVPAEMEAVFAPWYRAPQTATRAPGSGLGLGIARRLTLAMRGELQLKNRRTGGLEASVTLPLAAT